MTYYAIQSRDKLDYWNQAISGWDKIPYLYSRERTITVQALRQHDTSGMKESVIVEVICDIQPIKAWVKKPVEWAYNIGAEPLHARLTDGTLRACATGWEVYE